MKKITLVLVIAVLFFAACNKNKKDDQTVEAYTSLKAGFMNPPDSTKPGVYWYFISGHISKEGITKDLEAMKKVGIGEVFIGDIFYEPPTNNSLGLIANPPMGNTPSLSEAWWDCMRHAIKEGSRIGIDISFFNSPGWSQSGGPWVKEEEAMRYLTYSDTMVSGGGNLEIALTKPKSFFQEVAVLAYPVAEVSKQKPNVIPLNVKASSIQNLLDQDKTTVCTFDNKENETIVLEVSFQEPILARSVTLSPTKMQFVSDIEVQVLEDGDYRSLKKVRFDHGLSLPGRGPVPDGDMIISLDNITSDKFKIMLHKVPADFELADITISEAFKIEHATEKWLNKMANRGTPPWDVFRWETPKYTAQEGVLKSDEVIDLTEGLKGDILKWNNVPPGKWKIMRIGMTTTGQTNRPATPSARGLEVDKLSRKALRSHFEAYMGKFITSMTPDERKSLKRVIADSYETGPQNWTDDMQESFEQVYGYSPIPWLATLTGTVVNSAEESDRFLWDLRRLIADKVADEYVGGLREICEEYGISMWLENYGHFGFPSEFLKYGGRANEIGGEFWVHRQGIESRLAASASHIYGKNRVYAESYTSREIPYTVTPARLKKSGDWSYTEGINQGILHVYIHQPYTDKYPGVNAWFGTEFNRNNTWFLQSKEWITYLRRNYFLLQQGKHMADVCFFIGEDTPVMSGWVDAELSKGYDFDFINAEVLLEQAEVKDGRLVLQSGANYGALVLPPWNTMRPELLLKLKQLVEQGATIIGAPPEKSPSLEGYPLADVQLQETVKELWGKKEVGSKEVIHRKIGKGNVYYNGNINAILKKQGVFEDVMLPETANIKWVHRKLKDLDVYYLTNQGDMPVSFEASFRVQDKSPELWSVLDGSSRKLPEYSNENNRTTVPLHLNVSESYFVVFKNKGEETKENTSMAFNFTPKEKVKDMDVLWDIHFKNEWVGTDFNLQKQALFDWTTATNENVKYFSGTASYKTSINLKAEDIKQSLFLNFEHVAGIAEVKLNGVALATIWTTPYSVSISEAAKAGENMLEIDLTNNWTNQLLWQYKQDEEARKTWEFINVLGKRPDAELMPSGVFGKVWLSAEN